LEVTYDATFISDDEREIKINMYDKLGAGIILTYPGVAQSSPRGHEIQLISVLSQNKSRKLF
jgi:hypothetical protein